MGSPFSGSLLAKGEVGEVAEAEQQTELACVDVCRLLG